LALRIADATFELPTRLFFCFLLVTFPSEVESILVDSRANSGTTRTITKE